LKKSLKKLLLKAKKEVFSENIGNNKTRILGEGYDFAELREYVIGDDIRHIDWIISAKLQKPFVKLFHAERELNIGIVFALSGSMEFGVEYTKQEIAAYVGALLGFSAIKNGDSFFSYCFTDKMEFFIPPTKNMNKLFEITDRLSNIDTNGKKVNYESITETILTYSKKRSLIFVIGDFFEIPNLKILNKKHEVSALIVRDRFEESPKELGVIDIIDPTSGEELEFDFNKESITRYVLELKIKDGELFDSLRKDGVRFLKIYSDMDIYSQLRLLFS